MDLVEVRVCVMLNVVEGLVEGCLEGEGVGVSEEAAAVILPNTKLAPETPTT